MTVEYAIVNARTGFPLSDPFGDPITVEGKTKATEQAAFYTAGNDDDYEAVPLDEVDFDA